MRCLHFDVYKARQTCRVATMEVKLPTPSQELKALRYQLANLYDPRTDPRYAEAASDENQHHENPHRKRHHH